MKIDLSKLPEGTKWIAIDEDGSYEVASFFIEPDRDAKGFYYTEYAFNVIGQVRAVHR